ncbi:MAG TPA: AsnC family transcriptional regulator [Vicinamibacterales bacterium]|nr:AsnC family transcriptional regulator [Vicinamibacterales bacterium]
MPEQTKRPGGQPDFAASLSRESKLDATDERIIGLLQTDGRISNRAVGREVGLSEGAIRKRLRRLMGSGALSYGLIVDVDATGVATSGWLSVELKPSIARSVALSIGALEHCVVCCITTGSAAVRAYIHLQSTAELEKIVRTLAARRGVIAVGFRSVVGHAQHRYGMIMLSERRPLRKPPYRGGW